MLRSLSVATAFLAAFVSHAALAGKAASTQPGYVAKAAFAKQTGRKLAHTREIMSFDSHGSRYKMKVLGWNGAVRGPGAKEMYLFVVPSGASREAMIRGTKVTGNIENAGRRRVAAHLRAQGLAFTGIALGDHVTQGRGGELLQHPVSRESGFLRYTVTMASGEKVRYLVPTSAMKMVKGELEILGDVFRDTDTYGQKTVR